MMVTVRARAALFTSCLLLVSVSLATAEHQGHPDLEKKAPSIKRIALIPAQIEMFEIGAGGTLEKMEEWSQTARSNSRQAIKEELAKREHIQVIEFDERSLSSASRSIYDETFLLYDAASTAIITHAFVHPNASANPALQQLFFPWRAREFTYSLGKEVNQLGTDVDAYLLIRGLDQRSSGGRKALGVGTAIIGAALGVVAVPRSGANLFTAALIDAHTGDILWYSRSMKAYDLREPAEARKLIVEFMVNLPTLGPLPTSQ